METKEISSDPLNRIWKFFTSVKLTVALLLTIAATSVIGTLIPQNKDPVQYRQAFGDLLYSFWVNDGTVITYSYSNVSSSTPGKRFILTGVTGPASPITVIGPVSVTGNYKTQYQVYGDCLIYNSADGFGHLINN